MSKNLMAGSWSPIDQQHSLARHSLWLTAVLFILTGCGAQNPDLVPVSGIVTMDGHPVAELIVTFTPIGSTIGNGALGGTDTEGHFLLSDVRGGLGAHEGEYKISLYPAPSSDKAGLPTDVVSSGAIGLPGIFLNPNDTPLRTIVPAVGAQIEIALSVNVENTTIHVQPVTKE